MFSCFAKVFSQKLTTCLEVYHYVDDHDAKGRFNCMFVHIFWKNLGRGAREFWIKGYWPKRILGQDKRYFPKQLSVFGVWLQYFNTIMSAGDELLICTIACLSNVPSILIEILFSGPLKHCHRNTLTQIKRSKVFSTIFFY